MDWLVFLATYGVVSSTRNIFTIHRQGERIEHRR